MLEILYFSLQTSLLPYVNFSLTFHLLKISHSFPISLQYKYTQKKHKLTHTSTIPDFKTNTKSPEADKLVKLSLQKGSSIAHETIRHSNQNLVVFPPSKNVIIQNSKPPLILSQFPS